MNTADLFEFEPWAFKWWPSVLTRVVVLAEDDDESLGRVTPGWFVWELFVSRYQE